VAGAPAFAVESVAGGQLAGAIDDLGQNARTGRRSMDDDEDGGREIVRQLAKQVGDRLHAAAGADDQDVTCLRS